MFHATSRLKMLLVFHFQLQSSELIVNHARLYETHIKTWIVLGYMKLDRIININHVKYVGLMKNMSLEWFWICSRLRFNKSSTSRQKNRFGDELQRRFGAFLNGPLVCEWVWFFLC